MNFSRTSSHFAFISIMYEDVSSLKGTADEDQYNSHSRSVDYFENPSYFSL